VIPADRKEGLADLAVSIRCVGAVRDRHFDGDFGEFVAWVCLGIDSTDSDDDVVEEDGVSWY
jgi:hypothetical protein